MYRYLPPAFQNLINRKIAGAEDKQTYYHGSPHKLTSLRKGSWVTPHKEDAAVFGVPWGSKELTDKGSADGRPPKMLSFKDNTRTPKDQPVYVYRVRADVKKAKTNTGADYDWNRQTLKDTPVELVERIPSWKERFLKNAAEFAPGIPDRKNVEPLPEIKDPETWTLAIQDHEAERAGRHFDLRLVDPATGHAHSWAIPKALLPDPGKSVLAVQQPTHTKDYAVNFDGEIRSGYGKGRVKLKEVVDTEVFHSTPEETGTRVRFNVYKSTGPEEYAIVRTSGGNDLLVNKTLSRERLKELEVGQKPKTKERKIEAIDFEDFDEVMMPKYDGAHTLLSLRQAGRIPRLFSYRTPKKHKAGVIEHTHKVPSLLKTRVPKELKGTVLRTETIAVRKDGRAVPASDLAGLLNATVPNSRSKQKELEAELRTVIFDIDKYKGKDVSDLPFTARYELMKEVHDQLGIPVADVAQTPKAKRKLVESIRNKRHLLTGEGVILRPKNTAGPAVKAKFRPDFDVYVRDIYPTTKKDRAGGFDYSWTPKGELAGRVGTGFNHALAKAMLDNPELFIGRAAKVEAEKRYTSGALSKPAFKEWHLDKGNLE